VLKFIRQHGFTLGLIGAVALAWYSPEAGTTVSFVSHNWFVPALVWLIFLLQGLVLCEGGMPSNKDWVQAIGFVLVWNFILTPLIMVSILWCCGLWGRSDFILGYLLLSILPTTIAAAVAFTSVSGGRVSTAIFATVASNLFAVWVVPGAAFFYLTSEAQVEVDFWSLLSRLAGLILLPLTLGISLRAIPFFHLLRLGGFVRPFTQLLILGIVYVGFAKHAAAGQLQALQLSGVVEIAIVCLALLIIVSALVSFSARKFNFLPVDIIAVYYCGSQKSLAMGLPLISSILLAAGLEFGYVEAILPIMCYHPMQLIAAGMLCKRFVREAKCSGIN
jgi:sodium/bile acid cotransporter 7